VRRLQTGRHLGVGPVDQDLHVGTDGAEALECLDGKFIGSTWLLRLVEEAQCILPLESSWVIHAVVDAEPGPGGGAAIFGA